MRPSRIKLAFSGREPENRAAMIDVYERYREPVRNYIRHNLYGPSSDDRVDELIQKFFAVRIEKLDLVKNWDPERTPFVPWLFGAVRNFLRKENSGGRVPLSLEEAPDLSHRDTPDLYFIRDCTLAVIRCALERLRVEYEESDKIELHRLLVPHLPKSRSRDERPPYTELASEAGKTEGALRVDMYHLRKAWERILRDEIEQAGLDPELMLRSLSVREWE